MAEKQDGCDGHEDHTQPADERRTESTQRYVGQNDSDPTIDNDDTEPGICTESMHHFQERHSFAPLYTQSNRPNSK